MKTKAMYSQKIRHYSHVFDETVKAYRDAVTFFISVCIKEWDIISFQTSPQRRMNALEAMTHPTAKRLYVLHCFDDADKRFYKFPSYLRRAACMEAIGKVSSYKSSLENWRNDHTGKRPGDPKAGYVYPCLYHENMYKAAEGYTAKIKVYIRNTWDWITIKLRKSDVDYVRKHCSDMKQSSPTLRKRGKEWFLDFLYEKEVDLTDKPIMEQTVLAVDLGINSACTCSALLSDGTVVGRRFLHIPTEEDCLSKSIGRIKKAQQHCSRKTPRLWAVTKGISDDIAVKTASFIMECAERFYADVIVFEYLDRKGKKRGSRKQRIHIWRAEYVQSMVENKAHRLGLRISRVNAWGTSRLAFDGSGRVKRGKESDKTGGSYSICEFATGKVYNCDLNASYNIGARYFIREITKSLPERERLASEAKVPQIARRSTCTLSTLIDLYAELTAA